jgi:WD40 repeat protein
MIHSGSRPGFGPEERPPGRHPAVGIGRVHVLTPGWSAIALVAIAVVLGFEDADDRLGGGGASSLSVGQSDQPIRKVAFTPDNTQVAALEGNGRLTFWEAEGGGSWITIGGEGLNIRSFAFDPGGDRVAVGTLDGSIRLMSLRTGRDCGSIELDHAPVQALAFSPDGRRMASGQGNGRLTVWEVETGSLRMDLKGSHAPVVALAFSPDGRWLASTHADGLVAVQDAETGDVRASVVDKSGLLRPLVFSLDGGALWWSNAANWYGGGAVHRWDLGSGGGVASVRCPIEEMIPWDLGSGGGVASVSCPIEEMIPMPDGRSLLIRVDRERVWQLNTETLQIERRYRFPGRIVCSMGISSDGTRVALGGLEASEVAVLARFEDPSTGD